MAEVSLLRRINDSLAVVLNINVTVLFDSCTFCCYWIIRLINEIAIYLLEWFYLVNLQACPPANEAGFSVNGNCPTGGA